MDKIRLCSSSMPMVSFSRLVGMIFVLVAITFYRDDFNTDYTYTLPNSRTSDIVNNTRTSNVNQPGLWVFKVDNYSIIAGMCM